MGAQVVINESWYNQLMPLNLISDQALRTNMTFGFEEVRAIAT